VGESEVDETARGSGATRRQNVACSQIAVDNELFVRCHDVKSLRQLLAVIYEPSWPSIPSDTFQVVMQVSDAKGNRSLGDRAERARGGVI
jgi:hypothetical protein